MLLTILLVLLFVSLLGGGWGYPRYGYVGWSPFGLILIVLLILWLAGGLAVP